MPHLNEFQSEYASRGFNVISISSEEDTKIAKYMAANRVGYGVGRAFGVGQLYGYTGVPHAWLINSAGIVLWHGHTNELTHADIDAALAAATGAPGAAPGARQGSDVEGGGDTWWIWLIIVPAVLFAGAMGWFLWSSRDRTANYQTAIYTQPQAAPRPQGPPQQQPPPQGQGQAYGQQPYPNQYGAPQAFPGQPGSSALQEPYQGGNRAPGSKPNTRSVPRPASTTQAPMPEPMELPPEPEPPKSQHYLGQKPASDFPPFDTNRNPQRGR